MFIFFIKRFHIVKICISNPLVNEFNFISIIRKELIESEISNRNLFNDKTFTSGSVVGSKVGLTNKQDFVSWIKENI